MNLTPFLEGDIKAAITHFKLSNNTYYNSSAKSILSNSTIIIGLYLII